MSKPLSAGRISAVLELVEQDATTSTNQWYVGAAAALRWVLRQDHDGRFNFYEERLTARTREMDRQKVQEYLGFDLSDAEWDDIYERALASGKWT